MKKKQLEKVSGKQPFLNRFLSVQHTTTNYEKYAEIYLFITRITNTVIFHEAFCHRDLLKMGFVFVQKYLITYMLRKTVTAQESKKCRSK